MSKRPPNEYESRLHQAALVAPRKELTAKQAESVLPDSTQRQNALNFLLGVGLFKGLTSPSGQLVFRAVGKEELAATKGLTGEENLVLSHIKSSGNEGIWTKHLKAKTSLHQTVIDRCLKTLTQKRLIKRVQSVQHITRKIYMLEGIDPSISLTGGPWYTDNELDTEFIQKLTGACYKLISDISFPKRRNSNEKLLYPISNAPQYPTAEQIRSSLKKARLTDTELTVEHVEMLLNVLILDGKIEKIPAFGSALWDPDTIADGDEASDDDSKAIRKRKKIVEDSSDVDDAARSTKKKRQISSDNESDEDQDATSKKSRKSTKDKRNSTSDYRRVGKKKKRKDTPSDSSSDDGERSRRKKKKAKKAASSVDSSDSESESESHRRRNSKSAKRERSSSPLATFLDSVEGGSVYRALREVATVSLGLMETPCGPCPAFEFCKEGGPVNPQECAYYTEWLDAKGITSETGT